MVCRTLDNLQVPLAFSKAALYYSPRLNGEANVIDAQVISHDMARRLVAQQEREQREREARPRIDAYAQDQYRSLRTRLIGRLDSCRQQLSRIDAIADSGAESAAAYWDLVNALRVASSSTEAALVALTNAAGDR